MHDACSPCVPRRRHNSGRRCSAECTSGVGVSGVGCDNGEIRVNRSRHETVLRGGKKGRAYLELAACREASACVAEVPLVCWEYPGVGSGQGCRGGRRMVVACLGTHGGRGCGGTLACAGTLGYGSNAVGVERRRMCLQGMHKLGVTAVHTPAVGGEVGGWERVCVPSDTRVSSPPVRFWRW